jgi:PHS family inorganic phosphate transporter-like MFS transporter
LNTIDASPFQFWVVIVAGIGFLTDSFGLFALNVVTPMLGYVYWPHNTNAEGIPQVPSSIKTAMMCSTLAGTMLGQIAFGFAADVLGRRKMYGLELVVIIVGTMLLLMSSNGEKNSMDVGGWLIAWRAIMGKLYDFLLASCTDPSKTVYLHFLHEQESESAPIIPSVQ